jgi:hypothetical protein
MRFDAMRSFSFFFFLARFCAVNARLFLMGFSFGLQLRFRFPLSSEMCLSQQFIIFLRVPVICC